MKNRIFLMANNIVGLEICKYLKKTDNIVGLGVTSDDKANHREDIIKVSGLEKNIFKANEFDLDKIRKLKPDYSISCFWGYIMKKEFLDIAKKGNINFHPSYLPYNRGMCPNVWSFIDDTPAGVTIHYMDEGIDTGKILVRKEIEVELGDTAGSLNEKTQQEIVKLFKDNWEGIKNGKIKPYIQEGKGTHHYLKEVDKLDAIDLDKKYTGRELIDRLRSRTYGNKSFAYYYDKGVKVNVGVFLKEDGVFQYLLSSDVFIKKEVKEDE